MYSQLLIPSPVGELIAVASEKHLMMLEFSDSKQLPKKLEILSLERGSALVRTDPPANQILLQTKKELSEYFEGRRKNFTVPLAPSGTDFQKKAWKALEQIPYSETRSYKEEAILAGNPKAVRAIGGANNRNPIVVVIPCHRVIGANGDLVGYGGGIERKKWLLEHERKYSLHHE